MDLWLVFDPQYQQLIRFEICTHKYTLVGRGESIKIRKRNYQYEQGNDPYDIQDPTPQMLKQWQP